MHSIALQRMVNTGTHEAAGGNGFSAAALVETRSTSELLGIANNALQSYCYRSEKKTSTINLYM